MAKLNTNSNVYTIVYSTVLVIIVAFLLAFVASALKDTQDKNVERDTKSQILAALNLRDIPTEQVDSTYKAVIKKEVNDTDTPYEIAEVNGETKTIVHVKGAGLWGGIWGYVAVNADGQTIYGCFFNHESETAGLGARIKEQWFQDLFKGKKIYNDKGEVDLGVYKQGKAPANLLADYYVDAVTGATLTSNGVNDMLKSGFKKYSNILSGSASTASTDEQIPAESEYVKIKDINTIDQPIDKED